MERRSNQRCITNIPIVCSRLSSYCNGEPIEGVILNTSPDDFYAELKAHEKAGTVIVVRTTGLFRRVPWMVEYVPYLLRK